MQPLKFNHSLILFFSLFFTCLAHSEPHETTIASISNLDDEEFRSDEGNYFKLIKTNIGCKLEAHFFVSFENILYTYLFNRTGLISGAEKTFRYHYQKDYEGSLLHVTDVYQYSSARYDINQPDVKKNFTRYKALFSKPSIEQCLSP